jgi:glycosyltransferase involved in cell wall biosynthesis
MEERRIAFHAPLKPVDHPTPSGDRAMARLFIRLLSAAGFEPEIASTLRTFDAHGENSVAALDHEAAAEVERLVALYAQRPPAFWFTYHCYYKAPDLVGPSVARRLSIPYVVAEGSRAPERRTHRWPEGHRAAEAALDAADLILILNPRDRPLLEARRPPQQVLTAFPPFLDVEDWPQSPSIRRPGGLSLLTVAMMREGDKLASYRLLAEALGNLGGDWDLAIVGDGPARPAVETLFRAFGSRVQFRGMVEDRRELASIYAAADILAWPAINEAFGMVFLEAALQGCPAVAGGFGGVGEVVKDGRTGLIAGPGCAADFAGRLGRLAQDPSLRRRLGEEARRFVATERSMESAVLQLQKALAPLLSLRCAS